MARPQPKVSKTAPSRAAGAEARDARPAEPANPLIRLELYGIFVLAFAVALFLALISYDAADLGAAHGTYGGKANLLGVLGAHIADMFLSVLGLGSFAITAVFGWLGLSYIIGRSSPMTRLDVVGGLLGLLSVVVILDALFGARLLFAHPAGGAVGEWVGAISASLLSRVGTFLVFCVLGVVAVVLLTRKGVVELSRDVGHAGKRAATLLGIAMRHGDGSAETADAAPDEGPRLPPPRTPPEPAAPLAQARARGATPPPDSGEPRVSRPEAPAGAKPAAAASPPKLASSHSQPEPTQRANSSTYNDEDDAFEDSSDWEAFTHDGGDDDDDDLPAAPARGSEEQEGGIKIVESAAMRRTRELSPEAIDVQGAKQLALVTDSDGPEPFVLPSLSLLDYRPPETETYDRELLKRNAQILEAKLLDYKVKGKVVEIHPGPVVTMYEFMPAAGVKVSVIANLANDLAMALSAISIRIVAPIPGKNVVGIEIPNAVREIVWLKEILSDAGYARAKSRLTLALGKDIVGNPTCMDLAKAPHLLVAGATGAGKSVAINSFVVSLLYKAEPSDVRVIMVDPKMLELSIYEGIPHLLLPVVTDPKQAATALKWAVKEMERRYRLMADMGVRNLAGYNQKVLQLLEDPGQRLPEKLRMAKLKREAKGEVDPKDIVLDADGRALEKLPAIVVIIDELADLMMVASKEVEHCIARLAQMARASGIHLIIATQRPSVDVITGLIKANFPTRISFRVASGIDSRTILDQKGAEALLGMGDMLFLPPGQALQRVHGCYVSEDEVHAVVDHLRAQGRPEYDLGILASDDEDSPGQAPPDGDGDELYDHAVRIAAEARSISTSYLQRKLKIGYNRAARIIEQMEENGIIGPSDGTSRPREVFIEPL